MDPSGTFTLCQAHRGPHVEASEQCHEHCHDQTAVQDLEKQIIDKNSQGWRRIVLNFTPSWFAVNMGTGIASILLHNLPYNADWLRWIAIVIFALNVLLFVVFLAISILRYVMFPGLFTFMIRHPVQSLFVGTFPMGLATIINMIVFVCVPAWGPWVATLAWSLWWIDAAISISACVYLPFVITYVHANDLSHMTAAWLLPIVSTIVASASGGIVAEVLPDTQHAQWTVIISYILWGTGFPLAMVVLVMYFHRLTIYNLPPREVIVSVFLPLGPIGQGSFALMQLGKVAKRVYAETQIFGGETAGLFCYNIGNFAALIIWGYGLVWLFMAVASISRSKFPFNMGWWGFTFPLGVYTVATTTLAKDIPSLFFKVLGTIMSIMVVILWSLVSVKTIHKALSGSLFAAPCVKAYEKQRAESKSAEIHALD